MTPQEVAAAQALAEFSDFNLKHGARAADAASPQGRGRPDRHRRQGSGVSAGQDHAVSLQGHRQADRSTVPVLVAYGQIGRYTMTDLQEDRSMLRNLLALGVDVYAVDWGNPTRSDRWLTFEDYVDGYLDDCVEFICRAARLDSDQPAGHLRRRRLLAVLCRALSGSRQEPDPDDHAGRLPPGPGRRAREPRLHQPVDARHDAGGHRPADRGQRQSAGRADELRVRADDAGRTLSKYNVGLLDTSTTRRSCSTSCAWRSGSRTARTTPARPPSSG